MTRRVNHLTKEAECTRCKEWKPFGAFWKEASNPFGRHARCAECEKELKEEREARRTSVSDAALRALTELD